MSLTVERSFHLGSRAGQRGGWQRTAQAGPEPAALPAPAAVHPLARRMAMAITCLQLVQNGAVADAASLAEMAGVTRARMTQILNMTLLAPDIQAAVLDLPADAEVSERDLRSVMAQTDWIGQRQEWARLAGESRRSS